MLCLLFNFVCIQELEKLEEERVARQCDCSKLIDLHNEAHGVTDNERPCPYGSVAKMYREATEMFKNVGMSTKFVVIKKSWMTFMK